MPRSLLRVGAPPQFHSQAFEFGRLDGRLLVLQWGRHRLLVFDLTSHFAWDLGLYNGIEKNDG